MKIFISYRRNISFWFATHLAHSLTQDDFDVFIDYEKLKPGPYPKQLEDNIINADALILVLGQNSLDNCIHENDWVRREVEIAINLGIDIIPVLDSNFDWKNIELLPDSIKRIYYYQSIYFTSDNVDNSIEKLKRLLGKIPLKFKKSKFYSTFPNTFIDPRKLLLMNDISNAYKLQSILSGLKYNRSTTSTLRNSFDESKNKNTILNFATEIVINLWPPSTLEEKNVIGLASTLLGLRFKMWDPKRKIIEKLSALCNKGLKEEDTCKIEFIEPISIALGGVGESKIHRSHFYQALSSEEWGKSDTMRVMGYYGEINQMLLAIKHHLKDHNRKGLLKASDLNRVLFLARNLPMPEDKYLLNTLSNYATEALAIIKDYGDHKVFKLSEKQVNSVFW